VGNSIDKETLETLSANIGGADNLRRIVVMYTGKLPAEIENLRSALHQGDFQAVREGAHRLKSSSGQLGAARLSVMLAGLEESAGEADPAVSDRILGEVEIEADLVGQELEAIST